mmetsp:Transcript_20367/g.47033  ORF Transcript_20367/g.47033 Transcript_20367/m.47033 type:complete len:178 (-) Transcript_20367:161-694(-)
MSSSLPASPRRLLLNLPRVRGRATKKNAIGERSPDQPRPTLQGIPIQMITRTPGDDSEIRYATSTPLEPKPRPTPAATVAQTSLSPATSTSTLSAGQRRRASQRQPFEVEVWDVAANEPNASASLPDIEGCISSGFCSFSKDGTVKFGGDTYACAPAGDGIHGKAPSLADCAVWYKV